MIFLSLIVDEQDRHLLEKLYNEYAGRMFAAAFKALGSASDAEDAVQTVFMRIAEARAEPIKDYATDKQRRAYLFTAVNNEAKSELRGRSRALALKDKLIKSSDLSVVCDDPVEQICQKYDPSELTEAMSGIDELYRIPLYYHYGEGLSIKETAELLGRTQSAVKQQLVRGKKLLFDKLKEEGERFDD